MRALRRYVFPVVWLAIFAVIAAALFKLAFVDGMRAEAVTEQPTAQLVTPSVPATLGTVTNVVQIEGAVASDAAVAVRSTAEGTVNFLFVDAGANVSKGDPLFQVQKLVEPDPALVAVEPDPDRETGPAAGAGVHVRERGGPGSRQARPTCRCWWTSRYRSVPTPPPFRPARFRSPEP